MTYFQLQPPNKIIQRHLDGALANPAVYKSNEIKAKVGSEVRIVNLFHWSDTPQGYEYWDEVDGKYICKVIAEKPFSIELLHNPQPRSICVDTK